MKCQGNQLKRIDKTILYFKTISRPPHSYGEKKCIRPRWAQLEQLGTYGLETQEKVRKSMLVGKIIICKKKNPLKKGDISLFV